jgi:plastocyanin
MTDLDPAPTPASEPAPAPGSSDAASRRRTALAVLAAVTPIVIAIIAIAAFSALDSRDGNGGSGGSVANGQTYTYVIPAGTAEKMRNNQFVADILPEYVDLAVGDRIVVENEDSATHTFGPITVRANETTAVDFINAGIYFGLCTVGAHDSITIRVT